MLEISAEHFGCSAARNKGPTVCTNKLTIRRDLLESTVLDGLRGQLMEPELYREFAAEFTREWNRLQAEASGDIKAREAELSRVKTQLERLVDALVNDTPISAVNDRMQRLEERRIELEAELASTTAPAPRLHPNLAEVYREKVAALTDALTRAEPSDVENVKLREMVRSLVEEVRLVPDGRRLRVELRGELAAILGLAGAANGKLPGVEAEALAVQVKMVAGTGTHRDLNLPPILC